MAEYVNPNVVTSDALSQIDKFLSPTPSSEDKLWDSVPNISPLAVAPTTPEQNKVGFRESALSLLNNPQQMLDFAAAEKYGNEQTQDPTYRALTDMSTFELAQAGGQDVVEMRDRLRQAREQYRYMDDNTAPTSTQLGDFALDAASGVVGIVGSAASLVASGVGVLSPENGGRERFADKLSIGIAKLTEDVTEGLQAQQSVERQVSEEAGAIQTRLDRDDSDAIFDQDQSVFSGKSSLEAGLSRMGRNWVDTWGTLLNNPDLLAGAVGQGVGSLPPSSVAVKLATRGAARLAARNTNRSVPSNTIENVSVAAIQAGAPASAIGATEAAGVYSDITNRIMVMSEEDLQTGSDVYRSLRADGYEHAEAQRRLAVSAGQFGAAKQFGPAVIAGRGVQSFERNPLRAGSMREAGRNVVTQTLEEGFQGGTGAFNANVAIAKYADPDVNLTDGVGEAVAEGQAAGAGMAAGLGAPAVVNSATRSAATGIRDGVKSIKEGITKAREDINGAQDARTERTAPGNRAETITRVIKTRVNITEAVETLVQSTEPADIELGVELNSVITMSEDEITNLPKSVAENSILEEDDGNPTQPTDRINRLVNTVRAVVGSDLTPADRDEAALYVYDESARLFNFLNKGLPENIESLPDDNPIKVALVNAKENLNAVLRHGDFNAAVNAAREVRMPIPEEGVNPKYEINEATVKRAEQVAVANPTGVDPGFIDMVLNQSENNEIELSESSYKSLKFASDITREVNTLADSLDGIESDRREKRNAVLGKQGKPLEETQRVNREIMDFGEKKEGLVRRSLKDYYNDIAGSIKAQGPVQNAFGETVTAQDSADFLKMFATHMSNKMEAVNVSNSTPEYFRWLSPIGKFMKAGSKGQKPITIHRSNPKSVALGKRIYAESLAAVEMYNRLIDTYGGTELNGEKLPLPALAPHFDVGFDVKANAGAAEAKVLNSKISQLKKTPKIPIVSTIKSLGGVRPTGSFGKELQARGITPKSAPGLFNNNGRDNFDNLIQSEYSELTAFSQPEDASDLNGYISEQKVLDELVSEIEEGSVDWRALMAEIQELEGELDGNSSFIASLKKSISVEQLSFKDELDASVKEQIKADNDLVVIDEGDAPAPPLPKTKSKDTVVVDPKPAETPTKAETVTATPKPTKAPDKPVVKPKVEATAPVTPEPKQADKTVVEPIDTVQVLDIKDFAVLALSKTKAGISRMARAFTITKDSKSKLTGMVEPFLGFMGLVEGSAEISDTTRNTLQNMMDVDAAGIKAAMNKRLQTVAYSNSKNAGTSGKRVIEAIENDEGVSDIARFRNTAMVNPETGEYDSMLLEQATLAALHWVMNLAPATYEDLDRMAKGFGIKESDLTDDMIYMQRAGITSKLAKEELGRLIMEFWGVQPVKGVTATDTRGISESIASELLFVMQNDKTNALMYQRGFSIPVIKNGVVTDKFNTMYAFVADSERLDMLTEDLGNDGEIIRTLVSPDAETRYLFRPAKGNQKTQKRNRMSPLSVFENRVINNNRQIEFKVNQPMVSLMSALGEERLSKLLGFIDLTKTNVNKNHQKSIEGKNSSVKLAVKNTALHLKAVDGEAEKTGKDVSTIRVFYDFTISKVGRLNMAGFGPQNSKWAREMFVSTDSVLDMSQEEDAPMSLAVGDFWITVAQSSGLVKTEKQARALSIEQVQNEIYDKYGKSIEALQAWQSRENGSTEITADEYAVLANEVTDGEIEKLLHSLMAVAQYENAKITGGEALTSFAHNLSVEADGKTDGPINAMIHFMKGEFTQTQVDLLAKGGMFFNKLGMTLNKHIQTDGVDLYEVGSAHLSKVLATLKNTFADDKKTTAAYDAMERFLTFFGEAKFIDGELIVGRGMMKNPLTVTVYGSGLTGITDKVAGALIDELYAQMSELAQNDSTDIKTLEKMAKYKEIEADFDLLFGTKNFFNKKEKRWKNFNGQPFRVGSSAKDFTLTKEQSEAFTTNVQSFLTEPMVESINDLMKDTTSVTKNIQSSTQVQSAVVIEMFEKLINAETAKQRASGQLLRSEILSTEDYDKILMSLQEFAPIIDNEDQSIHLGTSESQDSNVKLSESMTEDYNQNASMAKPVGSGVKAGANLTQNRGDALMINNIYEGENYPKKTLAVYDGVEMAADRMREYGERINAAVAKGWLTNPTQDASDSFDTFMRLNGLKDVTERSTFEALVSALTGGKQRESYADLFKEIDAKRKNLKDGKNYKAETEKLDAQERAIVAPLIAEIKWMADKLQAELRDDALSIQARKNVMKRMNWSTDHMATTETPYDNVGTAITGDLITGMNKLYDIELRKLTKKVPFVETQKKPFMQKVAAFGSAIAGTNLVNLDGRNVVKMLKSIGTLSKDQKEVIFAIGGQVDASTQFIFGSKTELTAYRDETYPQDPGAEPRPDVDFGQIDMANNVVYIANQSAETVLHEIVHATTFAKVHAVYTNNGKATDADIEVVNRLELLMQEFLKLDMTNESESTKRAAVEVYNQVIGYLDQNTGEGNAAALNEFMAWSLTNQSLVRVMQSTKVRNPLLELSRKVLAFMGRLLGFQRKDLFSNVLFMSTLLTYSKDGSTQAGVVIPNGQLLQHSVNGSNTSNASRIEEIRARFIDKLAIQNRSNNLKDRSEAQGSVSAAIETARDFHIAGFDMNAQEFNTFTVIQATIMANMELDKTSLVRAGKLYDDVMSDLVLEDLMVDPTSSNSSERQEAQDKFNALTALDTTRNNSADTSTLLASFLALSQVNEEFRDVLSKRDVPKAVSLNFDSVDEMFDSAANSALAAIGISIRDEGTKNKTVTDALDKLTLRLGEADKEAGHFIELEANALITKADDKSANLLGQLGDVMSDFADKKLDNTESLALKAVYNSVRLIGSVINEDRGSALAKEVISLGNTAELWTFVRNGLKEVIGLTDDNKAVLMLVDKVKAGVSKIRQSFRENLPKIFAKKFTRKVTDEEYSRLFLGIAKADIVSLKDLFTPKTILGFFNDTASLDRETKLIEAKIAGMTSPKMAKMYMRKAKELADDMVGTKTHINLLRNAEAIARMPNEGVKVQDTTPENIAAIDQLVSLYAIAGVDQSTKDTITEFAQDAQNYLALDYMIEYIKSLKDVELKKSDSVEARINGYKGYIPSDTEGGTVVRIERAENHAKLLREGYTRIGEYKGMGSSITGNNLSYYVSTVSAKATYTQGAMQTVQQSVNGVDPASGRTLTGRTAGTMITGPAAKQITRNIASMTQAQRSKVTEPLLPVFDADYEIVGYEQSIAPEQMMKMKRNTNIGEMIGSWAGRQAEEQLAVQWNDVLVERLNDMWKKDKAAGKENEYVDLSSDSLDDPIYKDAWSMVPNEMRQQIVKNFGGQGFMVRKDMIDDAVGFRNASVADLFTGQTRLNSATQAAVVDFTRIMFGDNAFKYLVTTEKGIQTVVSYAKQTVVIRSVVVPALNGAANVMQLVNAGVKLTSIGTGAREKLIEIDAYGKNRAKIMELEADLEVNKDSIGQSRKLTAQIKALNDVNNRMSIAPLIREGAFTTIAEGLDDVDHALVNGKFTSWVETTVNKFPTGVKDVARYGLVTQDTSLFKGLAKAVQYGDFIAKAVLYDHLTKEKGQTHDQAMERVFEEFVAFNLSAGRTRTYAESIGLTWFWAFKIRSMKIALRMARKNPLRSLVMTAGIPYSPMDIGFGSPIKDNFAAVALDGRLDGSMGWDMLGRFWSLNPAYNLFN